MTDHLLNTLLFELHGIWIFCIVVIYFFILYFCLGFIFNKSCLYLERKNIVQKIIPISPPKKQIQQEVLYSIQSIGIFGILSVLLIYLIRLGTITLASNSILQIGLGILILNLWNEIHFFLVHKLMHLPFFMKHVHKIHHQSYIPTIHSVYSFHWFEALLLGSLPLTIAPFINLSPLVFALYPICSILINFTGHCNYRIGNGKGATWKLISSNHNQHHYKAKKNYGFATDILDRLFNRKQQQ